MNFPQFFRRHLNKVFAVSFLVLGLGLFLADVIHTIAYFPSSIGVLTIISWFIEGGVIIYLLTTNLRNDPRAYFAITMWIFLFFLTEIQDAVYSQVSFVKVLTSSSSPALISMAVLQAFFAISTLALGIILYVFVRRYMVGAWIKFSRIRLFAIAYAFTSLATSLFYFTLIYLSGFTFSFWTFLPMTYKFLCDIAVVFTLERLRRI